MQVAVMAVDEPFNAGDPVDIQRGTQQIRTVQPNPDLMCPVPVVGRLSDVTFAILFGMQYKWLTVERDDRPRPPSAICDQPNGQHAGMIQRTPARRP